MTVAVKLAALIEVIVRAHPLVPRPWVKAINKLGSPGYLRSVVSVPPERKDMAIWENVGYDRNGNDL